MVQADSETKQTKIGVGGYATMGMAIVGLALIVSGSQLGQWLTVAVGICLLVAGFGMGAFQAKTKRKGV